MENNLVKQTNIFMYKLLRTILITVILLMCFLGKAQNINNSNIYYNPNDVNLEYVYNVIKDERKLPKSTEIELKEPNKRYNKYTLIKNNKEYEYDIKKNGVIIDKGVVEFRNGKVYKLNNKRISNLNNNLKISNSLNINDYIK